MKDPYYSRLNSPEEPWQERPEAGDRRFQEPGKKRFYAVAVVIALGLAVAFLMRYL